MAYGSRASMLHADPSLAIGLAAVVAGIALFLAVILLHRWRRSRYFARRDARVIELHRDWNKIVSGRMPPEHWRLNPFDSAIVEEMLLENIGAAGGQELQNMVDCLKWSGLLDLRIREARSSKGWKLRNALVALGRTRAQEAIPILAESLDSPDLEVRIAAVRGLGRTARPAAALPILDRMASEQLQIPSSPIKNALLSCCRPEPQILVPYLHSTSGEVRETIARVLAEVATQQLGSEVVMMVGDSSPEVRASAARAMAQADLEFALPLLSELSMDEVWFVRLRAVVSLANFADPAVIEILLRTLCDTHRMVRLRSASALVKQGQLTEIFAKVLSLEDKYALQVYVSEVQRAGNFYDLDSAISGMPEGDRRRTLLSGLADAQRALSRTAEPAATLQPRV